MKQQFGNFASLTSSDEAVCSDGKNLEAVRKECEVSAEQTRILDGHQKPILLLDKKKEAKILCPSVAPGNPKVGVMLPYAPVQLLIFRYDDGIKMPEFLVMTSGNTSGAPICRDDREAEAELSGFCDCMLSHDRKIRIRQMIRSWIFMKINHI